MDLNFITDYLTSIDADVILPLVIILFLLVVPWGPEIWQNFFTFMFAVKGFALLIFPEVVAGYLIQNKVDALHLQEIRCLGIILLADALSHILTRKSSDPTVKTSLLWSRTLYFAAISMLMHFTMKAAADSKKNNINLKLYQVSWPATVLFFIGYLYYSLAESDWGGYSEQGKTWRNVNIRVDFLIWFLHGILSFVFPRIQCQFQTTLTDLDTAHGFLARGMGASFLMLAITAGRSVNFLREEDKKSILLSHGVANLLFLMTMAFCQIFTKVFSEWHLFYGMSFVALTAINAFLGCDVPNMLKSAKFQIRNIFSTKGD
ncbi:uncharacterized protein LOC127699854 [Mytilus californianus]|uniref:uncharacterized protein LOC127699854 n=1 Tax=Mytilus californianus TaxID=6549 RepID=UPI0022467158|nr:uncharacterized protein LOC127699854 [Mytilus californianus]